MEKLNEFSLQFIDLTKYAKRFAYLGPQSVINILLGFFCYYFSNIVWYKRFQVL